MKGSKRTSGHTPPVPSPGVRRCVLSQGDCFFFSRRRLSALRFVAGRLFLFLAPPVVPFGLFSVRRGPEHAAALGSPVGRAWLNPNQNPMRGSDRRSGSVPPGPVTPRRDRERVVGAPVPGVPPASFSIFDSAGGTPGTRAKPSGDPDPDRLFPRKIIPSPRARVDLFPESARRMQPDFIGISSAPVREFPARTPGVLPAYMPKNHCGGPAGRPCCRFK